MAVGEFVDAIRSSAENAELVWMGIDAPVIRTEA